MRVVIAAMAVMATPAAGQFAPTINGGGGRLPSAYRIDARSPGPEIDREVQDIRHRIGRARRDGDLTRREARRLRGEADQLGDLADRYGAGRHSDSERRELETRAQVLRADLDRQRMQGQAKR